MIELPISFVEQMQRLLGADYASFAHALTTDIQPVSIRLNKAKGVALSENTELVPWSGDMGYYLAERPTFTFDPLFHAGAYYVQEASSMFLGEVIRQLIQEPVRYLDLCAAPGGKSTHAVAALPAGSLVVSNETVRSRATVLAENIAKWGSPFSVVTNNTAADWGRFTHYFDVIATDVPCSGEGMFRKDDTAITEWSPAAVTSCARRQESILEDVWAALRPGGLLIYSTCTYNIEENEAMVEYLVKHFDAEPVAIDIPSSWGIVGALSGTAPVYRFMPHRTRGEGLFMAVLRKLGEMPTKASFIENKEKKKKGAARPVVIPRELKNNIQQPDAYQWIANETSVTAYPMAYATDMNAICSRMNVLHAGIPVATVKGRDYIPTQALALSTALAQENFVCHEADLDTALAYLRREAIVLPSHLPRGYIIITYKQQPLGWVKNIGSRANNLYPQEWRIRSGHNPDAIIEAGVNREK